jgi:hypothetical protein
MLLPAEIIEEGNTVSIDALLGLLNEEETEQGGGE